MSQGIVLFHTTTSALRAEKLLQNIGLTVKLIPTPRQLSSDCGIALRFDPADQAKVERCLAEAGVEGEIHLMHD